MNRLDPSVKLTVKVHPEADIARRPNREKAAPVGTAL